MTPPRPGGTVLVTGGAGFIGCAISGPLVAEFDRVVAVDNLHPQVHPRKVRPAALSSQVELHQLDVTDADGWDALLRDVRPDVVVHLAAETGTAQSLTESSRHAAANVLGTTTMLDAVLRAGSLPARIVLTSSRAVYGEGVWQRGDGERFHPGQRTREQLDRGAWDFPDARPVAMDSRFVAPAPVSVYGATKLAQEHVLTSWARAVGVDPVVLRLQNVYGPGQSLDNPYTGIMSFFCRTARAGEAIPLFEDGEVLRDFVLIDDVADAVVRAVTTTEVPEHPVDIGAGRASSIHEAAAHVAAAYGAPAPVVTGQYRLGDVRHAWADVQQARDVLGWRARHDLADGVERLARWVDAELDATS